MPSSNNKQQMQLYFDTAYLGTSNDILRHLFQGKTHNLRIYGIWNIHYQIQWFCTFEEMGPIYNLLIYNYEPDSLSVY